MLLNKIYKRSKHYEGMALIGMMQPLHCVDDGHYKNPFMLSKEYATAMIDFLIAKTLSW